MITGILTVAAAILGVLAVVIPILVQRRKAGRSTDYDARGDIEGMQDAATRGDEQAVQAGFAEWMQKGRMRDPRRSTGPAGVRLYKPAPESDRPPGRGSPPQNHAGGNQ